MTGFYHKFAILIVFIAGIHHAQAQVIDVLIVDRQTSPLAGAVVSDRFSNFIGVSDQHGRFFCRCVQNDSLMITYLGFENKKIVVDSAFLYNPIIKMTEKAFNLNQVVIQHSTKSTASITDIDIKVHPVTSSQEVLRTVPGLFIGQHAGGGKAEQLFLRGFDIDHGTDVGVSVDGMPVNMVSHAHGQGYADLHFLIPELIERVDFGKGPYYADKGNFTTAAYVNFQLKKQLDNSSLSLEAGQFNSWRGAALLRLLNTSKTQSYVATEFNSSDGWFTSPQNFKRFNVIGRWQTRLNNDHVLSIMASHFTSDWDASGQIPYRAIKSGLINRFGAIDDNEGGKTSRKNLLLSLESVLKNKAKLNQTAYYSSYDFDLFSNFTFFLNDPVYGDQINQKEHRNLLGYQMVVDKKTYKGERSHEWKAGIGVRYDGIIENQLAHTFERKEVLQLYRKGDVNEVNPYSFIDYQLDFGKWLVNPSVRFDAFSFEYKNKIENTVSSTFKSRLSPKFNIIYQASDKLQYFLKSGIGFHSNDTRVVLEQTSRHILPAAKGADLGLIWKPNDHMLINGAGWILDLDQEFVYVGDEGIIEPGGRTRRYGLDMGWRYQPVEWLYINLDANYSIGRNLGVSMDEKYIPLAPVFTSMGAVTIKKQNFSISANMRHLSDRPATEDKSIIAQGYFINDFSAQWQLKKIGLQCRIENIFNVQWDETQFATLSRLKNERDPVEEIHFTPGTPFFIKAGINYKF